MPTLARFDPTSGRVVERHSYRDLDSVGNYAMKFWGGAFWIFLGRSIYRVSRDALDDIVTMLTDLDRKIVGVGVSTCAPLQATE